MDKFEKILREKFQGHEANLPAGEWEKFSQRLDGLAPKPSPWKAYLAGGMAAATIGVGTYFLLPSSNEQETKKPVVENTIAHNQPSIKLEDNKVSTIDQSNPVVHTNENKVDDKKDVVINEFPAVHKKEDHKTTQHQVAENNKISDPANKITDRKSNNPVTNNNENKVSDPRNNNQVVNHVPVQVQLVEPEISGNVREVCQHSDVHFKAANSNNDYEITWLMNGEEVWGTSEFVVTFNKPGTQTVQLVYGTVQDGKRITKESEKRFINVLPAPLVDMEVNKVNDFSPEYLFKAPAVEGNEYLWNFGDGKVQTGNNLAHVYRKKGEYDISLTVTAANGCKARKSEKVEIESDYNLLTPNAFSPNNDGHNDVFISEALKAMPDVRFRMIIFDKSGKKIFETTRLDNPWDGRNSVTGGMCAPDAYVWRVELSRPDGTKEEYMGSVTLLQN